MKNSMLSMLNLPINYKQSVPKLFIKAAIEEYL